MTQPLTANTQHNIAVTAEVLLSKRVREGFKQFMADYNDLRKKHAGEIEFKRKKALTIDAAYSQLLDWSEFADNIGINRKQLGWVRRVSAQKEIHKLSAFFQQQFLELKQLVDIGAIEPINMSVLFLLADVSKNLANFLGQRQQELADQLYSADGPFSRS